MDIDSRCRYIADTISAAGGKAYLVGGSVRDMLLSRQPKDYDIEVYGLTADALLSAVVPLGNADLVGESFGVVKLDNFDLSLPRRESKSGRGHRDFVVNSDPFMQPREACARRDFTINSMMLDLDTGDMVDFYGGRDDLSGRVLRHTSSHFSDDPLRVLRGMQFCGRFGLIPNVATVSLCRSISGEYESIATERVWGEWSKWAMSSIPSAGLRFLESTWIEKYPELAALVDCQQDQSWHPEGSAWDHTCQAVDAAARIADRERIEGEDRIVLVLAALVHDIGKPYTTAIGEDDRIRSLKHESVGSEVARRFLAGIGCWSRIIERVTPLVQEHMFFYPERRVVASSVRRLACRLYPATIQELIWILEVDQSARYPKPAEMPDTAYQVMLLARQCCIERSRPVGMLMGRHLIEMGMQPGPRFGAILRCAYDAQMGGEFVTVEGGIEWVRQFLTK
jgi:tRNA nucleotidyltransferase (CCA-adding enzyme)